MICFVIGTRPQFIKFAVLEKKIDFEYFVINTNQHYDNSMAGIFLDQLSIRKPKYTLEHKDSFGLCVDAITVKLEKEKPDYVVVFGDTDSTLAGALAAVKLNIPVIHIEAGMRSFDKKMQEETNRVTTDHIARINICSSEDAVNNLNQESIKKNVFLTGDLMVDSILEARDKMKSPLCENGYVYATIHRAENVDDGVRLKKILYSLSTLNKKIIFSTHPRTRKMIEQFGIETKNILFIDPVGYIESLSLQNYSDYVITDSGGIQKEAYVLKKMCYTFREETEWVETLKTGWNRLVNDRNIKLITKMVGDKHPGTHPQLYGNGTASIQIIKILRES